jgi:uncharacterized protein YecE (DUF72 family)
MEFGRVAENELAEIDFSLPKEPLFNKNILNDKATHHAKVYMGCSVWGRPEWVGNIYPPKTKEKDFLEQYVQHYNTVELNATHYKVYDAAMIEKWVSKAGNKDFLFCPKMYKGVTHDGSLKGKEALSNIFLESIAAFKNHLGPIFIQVSEMFSSTRKEELFAYLKSLPTDLSFFVEVRHHEWFSNTAIRNSYFETLRQLNIGTVITDAAGRRDCAHVHLTTNKAFIRFVGNSLDKTDYTRIDEWCERIRYWIENGLQELYFFMHMHNEAKSPELTVYLADKLNSTCGLQLQKPTFVVQQRGLFD